MTRADREAMVQFLRLKEFLATSQEAHAFGPKYPAYHRAAVSIDKAAARLRADLSKRRATRPNPAQGPESEVSA